MLHGVMVAIPHPQAAGGEGFAVVAKLFLLLARVHTHPLWLVIIFSLIAAAVCATVAGNRGRSKLGWGVLGLLFSVVAFIVLLVLPPRMPR
jgi:hypothetical protein